MRNKTKRIQIGTLAIGGQEPILVQSMLSLPPDKLEENLTQARELQAAGCDILRVAVPTLKSVELISLLKENTDMPIVADIHFDWRLALEAISAGADKIRINPGNIGSNDRVKAVANACQKAGVPIRIGVNSGSLEKEILKKHGSPSAAALAESALYHASLLEQFDFTDIVLSVKASDVSIMMEANKILAGQTDYPLHLGVTHAGTPKMGLYKSVMGIGGLLAQGVGDTIRVSLTAPPVEEIAMGKDILKAAGLDKGLEIVACPTCGRASVDVISLTHKVEHALQAYESLPITVAVMGCVVNGPGEAKEADLGITGGRAGRYALFQKGEILETLSEDAVLPRLLEEVESLAKRMIKEGSA